MNCRTFHKHFEDYLEGNLDFAARFALERHARQCVHCGRELTSAQDLRRVVHDLERVKAPANFETSVLNEIATRKIHRRFSLFHRVMEFEFDLAYWRKYALAVSGCIILGLGLFYWHDLENSRTPQDVASFSKYTADLPGLEALGGDDDYAVMNPVDPMENYIAGRKDRSTRSGEGFPVRFQTDESDYRDYIAIAPDNRPIIIPLPDTIQLQISLPSEEYYIKNVSH